MARRCVENKKAMPPIPEKRKTKKEKNVYFKLKDGTK